MSTPDELFAKLASAKLELADAEKQRRHYSEKLKLASDAVVEAKAEVERAWFNIECATTP